VAPPESKHHWRKDMKETIGKFLLRRL